MHFQCTSRTGENFPYVFKGAPKARRGPRVIEPRAAYTTRGPWAAGSAAPYTKRASGRGDLPQASANRTRRAAWPMRMRTRASCKS